MFSRRTTILASPTIAADQEPEGNLLLAAAAPSEPPILLARLVTGSVVLLVVGLVGVGGPRTRAGRRLGVLRVGTTLVCFLLVQLPVPPGARACEHPTEPLEDTVFYHLDRLGSTELVTDHTGAVEEWLRHDPYGAVSAFQPNGTPKTAPGSTFQFTGQRGDDGTGLYYFGARFYEPALGLFVSPDPAGQFFSPYSYGGGNPLAGTDPTGAEFSLFGLFIIALLSAVATIIDAVVQGASVGDAFKAGAISTRTRTLRRPIPWSESKSCGNSIRSFARRLRQS
jgi:RHS repeat-associated protein